MRKKLALTSVLCLCLLGQSQPPVAVWSAPPISTDQFESHPAFDPRTGDLWFVRSSPKFEGWRLKVSRCTAEGWSVPVDPPFAGDGVEADPWFSSDGSTLWFISSRTDDGAGKQGMDIWRVTRDSQGRWKNPERLPKPINSAGNEWFPRIDRDGWLYFGSDRLGGAGKTDIWRARLTGGKWVVENAGLSINGAGDEYEALPSPDGKSLLLATGDGYYRAERTATGWSKRVRLGKDINVNGSEIGALFSPSGRSWLYSRALDDGRSGEIMLVGSERRWPPSCPARRN
jgi:hypothetical protein